MKGFIINYSDKELKWIKAHCKQPRLITHQAFCKKFARTNVSLINFNALCKRNGWLTGRNGRFSKEHKPWNKGKKMPVNANSTRHQFKKGNLPHNTKHAGHERVTKDGYVEISINETNPHTGYERRYVLKHRHLWEKQNGKPPKGKVLKCLDGDKTNTDPTNWECIDRGLLPRLNGRHGHNYDNAPKELKPSIMMIAKVKHKAQKATPEEQNNAHRR